jgi:protein-tyrosine phosphatase
VIDPHDPRRVLGLSGAPNFRDLGGYRAAGGARVRTGQVYRSGKLTALTAEDRDRLAALGVQSVIDLRAQEERDREPSEWPTRPPAIHESPRISIRPEMQTSFTDLASQEGARSGFAAFYARLPELYREDFAVMFRRIGRKGPTLVHCSAGKDRTGVACALLLWTLGVDRETIVADYVLTASLIPHPPPGTRFSLAPAGASVEAQAAMPPVSDRVRRVLWGAEPAYLASAFGAVEADYGSIEGYLTGALGLAEADIADVRRALLD